MLGPSAGLPPAVAGLLKQGLLASPVLVLGSAETARCLARQGLTVRDAGGRPRPGEMQGEFATVLDLGWLAHRPIVRRAGDLRDLKGAVAPGGMLHLLAKRGVASLRGLGRSWTLLAAQDAVADGADAPPAWLLTFAHTAPPRQPRRTVRHFTDLGAFGSLDIGGSTERSYGG